MLLASLALVATAAAPQTPTCLSAFQRVTPLSPVAADYRFIDIEVDGDIAIATGRHILPPHVTRLDVFERDPLTGQWSATQSIPLRYQYNTINAFELEGERLIVRRGTFPGTEIAVLEPDAVTGLWRRVTGIAVPYSNTAHLSGDRIAIGTQNPDRIEVWARTSTGTYTLEDTLLPPVPGTLQFPDNFAFEGDRIISTAYGRLNVFRRAPSGAWNLESSLDTLGRAYLSVFGAPPLFSGDRLLHLITLGGSNNTSDGVATWRTTAGSATTRVSFDGIVRDEELGNGVQMTIGAALRLGTAVVRLRPLPCGSSPYEIFQLGVIGTGDSDRPTALGRICQLAGTTTTAEAAGHDYDGRTIAVTVRGESAPIMTSVHFATLLGSDLDRDADCVEDAQQIAANAALDHNGNGRLDAQEERGDVHCVPLPNSAGTVAELRVIGTEFVPTQDMAALATGLPPLSFGVLAVALSPLPGQPSGPFQLCIGTGSTGTFGRYAALQADGAGTALLPLPSTLIPSAGGSVIGLPGDTWGWQLVYRDGSGTGTSSAVRVVLR